MDSETAKARIDRRRAYWEQLRVRTSDIAAKAFSQEESGHIDRDADDMMENALEAQHAAGSGQVRFGLYTGNLVLFGENREELITNARELQKEYRRKGFVCRVETYNAVEAYLGSLPGHGYQNVRKPEMSSMNLAHFGSFTTLWPGLEKHPSPLYPENSPPLMLCSTSASTPFRLNTHVSDVGSTLVLGPTGAGKTVLLNMWITQFMKYENAQVFCFDKGYGAYLLAKACEGNHYDVLGEHGEEVAFCPLSNVHDPNERVWAGGWIEMMLGLQGVTVSPERRQLIVEALKRLGESKSRTLTELLIQDKELSAGLKYYQLGGGSNGVLDAKANNLSKGRLQVFELDYLMNKGEKLVVPVLHFLFHWIDSQLDGRPTLIVIDEAWKMLMNSTSADQVEDWLRTIRKKNGALIMATQSLAEIQRSSVRDLVFESCPTKIFLPNPEATTPTNRTQYEDVGLTEQQIEVIGSAVPKRDYLYTSPLGTRLFNMDLGPGALSFVGANGKQNRVKVDALEKKHGALWCREWLKERGLDAESKAWEEKYYERNPHTVQISSSIDDRVVEFWRARTGECASH
jgi:type IV secretion system protein VirB4